MSTLAGLIPVGGPFISYAIQAWEFAHSFGRSDPLAVAVAMLQRQIDALMAALEDVNRRLDEHAQRIVKIENDRHMDKLLELGRESRRIAFEIALNPPDVNGRKRLGFQAMELANRFLIEPDIWQWTDIGFTLNFDDDGNLIDRQIKILDPDFKAQLALPLYGNAIMLLLAAIDLDTRGEPAAVRRIYGNLLERHIAAVLSRPDWDEFNQEPQTLPEMIRARITCRPFPLNKFAADGECVFGIVCENVMERRSTVVRDATVMLADRGASVLCTVDPNIGQFDEEGIEGEKGVLLLTELGDMMRRVLQTGSLREPFIGRFLMSPTLPLAVLYGIHHDGGVDWHRQVSGGAPGAPAYWQGPIRTRAGFENYTKVFPAGGNDFYALRDDGVLQWLRHNDFNTGGPTWTGPRDITFGWNSPTIISVIPGGDRVLYQLDNNGALWWLRHNGVTFGFDNKAWSGPRLVNTGFDQYVRLFSVGEGVMYGITSDGRLMWHRHKGFRDGSNVWEGPRQVGSGWQDFRDVFGTDNGVIYAQAADGTLLRYVHLAWATGVFRWGGPVPVAFGVGGYKQVITLMSRTPDPVN